MPKFKFLLDCRAVKPGAEAPLKLQLGHNRKCQMISLSIYLKPEQWDSHAERVISHKDKAKLNQILDRRRFEVNTIIADLMDREGGIGGMTCLDLKRAIVDALNPKKEEKPQTKKVAKQKQIVSPTNLKVLFEGKGSTCTTESTREKYVCTYRRIVAWLGEKKADVFDAKDMTLKWVEDFDAFMKQTCPSGDGRSVHLRNLKAVINYAIRHDLMEKNVVSRHPLPKSPHKNKNLGLEGIRRIIFAQGLPEHLERYRDFFVLSFMLRGLNTGDLCEMTKPLNGYVDWHRKKTGQPLTLKIEPEMQTIIDRYVGQEHLLEFVESVKNYRYFNNKLSPAIHKIREHINANSPDGYQLPEFTMYWARSTWASIAASIDIAFDTISVGLAHSLKRITDLYIERDPEKVHLANRRVLDYVLYGKDYREVYEAPKRKRGRPRKTA